MGVSVDQIKILVKAETSKAIANMKKTQGAAQKTSLSFKGMLAAGLGTAAITTAISAVKRAATEAVKTYIDFEQAIANVQSVAGGTKQELQELAKEAGRNTSYSASQSADAMYLLASSGLDVKDMAEVLNPTLNLAAAAQIGIADATNIVVGQLKSFGLGMNEAKRITDEMAQTVRKSNTTLGQLGEALKVAAPIANQFKVATADLNAILGELANRNIKGSEAGMLFRRAMIRLVKPTGEAKEALQAAGISLDEVQRLLPEPIKLFEMLGKKVKSNSERVSILGQRGVQLFNILDAQGVKSINDLQKAIENAGGAAEWMAEKQLDTLNGQIKLLNSAYEDVILTLMGESGLAMALKDVVTSFVASTKALGDWLRTAEGIAAVNITVKALGTIFSIVFNHIKTQIDVLSFLIDTLINSFSSLGQVIYYALTGNWEGVKAATAAFFEQTQKKAVETGAAIIGNFKDVGKSATSLWDAMGKNYSKQEKNMTKTSQTENSKRLSEFKGQEKKKTKTLQKEAKKRQDIEKKYTDYLYGSLAEQLNEVKKKANEMARVKINAEIKAGKISFETIEEEKKARERIFEIESKIYEEKMRKVKGMEEEIRNEYGITLKEAARMTKAELAENKKALEEKREQLKLTSEIINEIGANIASSIGGGAGEAVQGITSLTSSLVKAAATGDVVAAAMAVVGAAIGAVFTEIAKGQKFREMQQNLTLQRMEQVELAYHQEVLRLMDYRHQKEMNQLNNRLRAEMEFFKQSSEIGKQYQDVLAEEEQERIAQMDADEKRKYQIKKKYEEEKEKLEKEQEKKQKKLEEKQKKERNEARLNQFKSRQSLEEKQAKIDKQKAISEVHKTFPMPWDAGTRDSLISNLKSMYGDIISSIKSQKFLPELARGTGGFTGGLALVGERGPEIVNLPGGSQVIPNNKINNTNNMGNSFNIQNVSLPGVQNVKQFAEELNQYANSMGKTIFAGT